VPMGYPSPIEAFALYGQGALAAGIWSRSSASRARSPKSCPASVRSRCRWRARCTRISASRRRTPAAARGVSCPAPGGYRVAALPARRHGQGGWIAKRPISQSCRRGMRDLIPPWGASMSYQRPPLPENDQPRECEMDPLRQDLCWEVPRRANTSPPHHLQARHGRSGISPQGGAS